MPIVKMPVKYEWLNKQIKMVKLHILWLMSMQKYRWLINHIKIAMTCNIMIVKVP